jgi:Photosynthetic reaction centre cytochrome C subunit
MKTLSIALTICLLMAGTPNRRQRETASKAPAEPATPEEIKRLNSEQISALEKQIVGKEDQPSEAVFKNIKILTGIPAGNLLKIMQMGFSQSLGTSCAHCHVIGQYEKEDQPTKQIARDMWNMDHAVISDYLKKMEGLKDRNPLVNCSTCHRGQLKPALNLDAPKN